MAINSNTPPTVTVTVPNPTPSLSVVPIEGIDFTIDRAMPTQTFADGSVGVISTQDFNLVSTIPLLVQTGPDGIQHTSQGGMVDIIKQPTVQGWDTFLDAQWRITAGGPTDARWAYSDAVNKNPTGRTPLQFYAGDNRTYIQSTWRAFNTVQLIDRYIPFTVMSAALPAGSFRPCATTGTFGKSNFGITVNDIDLNVLRNISKPTLARSLDEATINMRRMKLRAVWSSPADGQKRSAEISPYGDFGASFGPDHAEDVIALHWSATNAAKQELAIYIIQRAIDLRGVIENGYTYGIGGAQNANGWVELVAAYFLTGDVGFSNAALAMKTNAKDQHFDIIPEILARNVAYPAGNTSSNQKLSQTWYQEMLWTWLQGSHEDTSSDLTSVSYFTKNDAMAVMEILAILCFTNGPGGVDGYTWLVSNGLGRLIDVLDDRIRMKSQWDVLTQKHEDIYTALRSTVAPTVVRARPFQPEAGIATAASGGFSVNLTNRDFSRYTPSDRQLRVSLDKRDGITFTGLSAGANTLTTGVLIGAPHWTQVRMVDSVAGPGVWSTLENIQAYNSDINPAGPPEAQVTPTGTAPTGAPVATASRAPTILIRPYSGFRGTRYDACAATVPVNTRHLVGSIGYWFGGGIPTSYDWKWQENTGSWVDLTSAVNVPVANLKNNDWGLLEITDAVRGKVVRFAVMAKNGSGNSSWNYSSSVTIPSKTEKTGYLTAETPRGLTGLTYRWQPSGSPALSYNAGAASAYSGFLLGSNSTAANRFISIDSLPALGDLSDVPEGEICAIAARGLQNIGNTNWMLMFRCTGANDTVASGYGCQVIKNSLGWRFQVVKFNGNGTRTTLYTEPSYRPEGTEFNDPNSYFRGGGSDPHMGNFIRVNWSLSGGNLRVRAKAWARTENFSSPTTEPSAWQLDQTFVETPLASGRLGFGMVSSARDVKYYGIGVSTDPTVSAPQACPIPVYTYS